MGYVTDFLEAILGPRADLQAAVLQLRKENEKLKEDTRLLRGEVAEERERHTRASFRINDMVKASEAQEQEVARLRSELQQALDARSADVENVKSAHAKYANDIRALRSAQVDIARAICGAVFGPDGDPVYDGEGVSMSYFHTLAQAVDRLRRQRDAIRCALNPFMPWFNHVLRTRIDEEVIMTLPVPGNLHQAAIRRRDIRVLRETMEVVR